MAKRNKSGGAGRLLILGIVLVGAAAFATYYGVSKLHWGIAPPKQKPVVTITPRPSIRPERTVYLYILVKDKLGFHLRRTPVTTNERGGILDAALGALLANNKQGGISAGLIPEGTRLLSPVEEKNGVATANLSHEFTDNFSGGSDQEAATVNSIVHTLVSSSDGKVQSVMILVEGKKVESLGGHLPLADPVGADSTLLKPGSLR